MSERKVLNKYYPADFDPSKIPRRKLGNDRQQVVRLMAPFSMQCRACHEFIYKGKKFNARKETAQGEVYFGIKIFRFYIKCPRCSNEITFKTDPKNTDYVAEHGAQRNFEPWREEEARPAAGGDTEDDLARLEAAELEAEEEDAMKALENRQMDSKREMDILDKLQEIRTRNARMERADAEAVLKTVSSRVDSGAATVEERETAERRQKEVEEDEEEVRRYFAKMQQDLQMEPIGDVDDDGPIASGSETPPPRPAAAVKRKLDEAEPEARSLLSEEARKVAAMDFSTAPVVKKKPPAVGGVKFGIKVVKKARPA